MVPERWLEVRVRSATAEGDTLVVALMGLGGRAVFEDDGWQVSHVADPGSPAAVEALLDEVRRQLPGVPDLELETRWQRQ